MKDEIKELLEALRDSIDDTGTDKVNFINWVDKIENYITTLQEENNQLKKRNKEIYDGFISATQELTEYAEKNERLNNIIEKTESMLKRLMEEQEYCYKKYPENWEERIGVSNTWLTSRDCYWTALNYLIKLKGSDKE